MFGVELGENMKSKLLKIYSQRQTDFKKIQLAFPEDDLAGPFLMSPNEKYSIQPNPLLIIGQETCGWSYEVDNLELQMQHYEEFNVGIDYYSSPFWNITRKIESALGNEPYSCAWSNLNKFDVDGGRPYGEYAVEISKVDDVLLDEIKIVHPKICMFYTGPTFDVRIAQIFPGVRFEKIEEWELRQFCKLIHPDLPEHSFRSYHPKSLRMRYLEEDFVHYVSSLNL